MATIKTPSKSMAFQKQTTNDLEKAQNAIANGAKVIVENVNNFGKEAYAIQYPQGGYYRITKNVYKKLQLL